MFSLMRMKTYRDYIFRKTVELMMVLSLIFVIVFVVGNLMKVSSLLANNRVDGVSLLKLIFYFIPFVVGYTLPVSMVGAVVLLFGRLSADKEIVALVSSGASIFRVVFPILVFSLVISALTFLVNDKFVPDFRYRLRKVIAKIGSQAPLLCLEENAFIDLFPGYIIYIHHVKENILKFVRIYQLRGDLPPRVLVADRGVVFVDERGKTLRMELEDVVADEIDPRNPDKFYKFHSKKYSVSFRLPENTSRIERKLKEYSVKGLIEKIRKFSSMKIDISPAVAEIHRRLSFSFAPFVLVLLSIPVAIKVSRRDASMGLILAGIVIFLYYVVMLVGDALVIREILPVWIGMWLPTIVFGFIGTLFYLDR